MKLDHDYCHDRGNNGGIGDNGSRSAASSSASAAMNTTSSPSLSDHSSKKDSGLESGDVSDCSSSEPSTIINRSSKTISRTMAIPPPSSSSLSSYHSSTFSSILTPSVIPQPHYSTAHPTAVIHVSLSTDKANIICLIIIFMCFSILCGSFIH